MKQLIVFLAIAFLTSCGSKKAITNQEKTSAPVSQETTITEVPKSTTPEVETDPIETPETPIVPKPPSVEIVQPEPPADAIPEPDPVTVEDIVITDTPYDHFDHSIFDNLLKKYVSDQGRVNYEGFKSESKLLRNYIKKLGEVTPAHYHWSNGKEEQLAYWMNAYNAMTIDLILRHMPLESIKDIKDPWDQRFWKLGTKYYNLNEIEHQILRKMGDARIHFGINCASFSCPPLLNEAFTAATVDTQLDMLARQFVNDSKRNTITANSIEVSKIFTWFAKDFKTDGDLIDFLNKYSEVQIASNAKKRFKDYDWTLNN